MRLLLDTHALLWWLDEHDRLTRGAYAAIEDPANDVLVSAVSTWEVATKEALGKLRAPNDFLERLHSEDFGELAISWEHGAAAGSLPAHHRDPFDRLLVAQAKLEGLMLVTRDPAIAKYDVLVLAA